MYKLERNPRGIQVQKMFICIVKTAMATATPTRYRYNCTSREVMPRFLPIPIVILPPKYLYRRWLALYAPRVIGGLGYIGGWATPHFRKGRESGGSVVQRSLPSERTVGTVRSVETSRFVRVAYSIVVCSYIGVSARIFSVRVSCCAGHVSLCVGSGG